MSLLFWHPRGQREADRAAATGVAEHTDGRHGPGHWRTGAIGGEVLRRLVAEGVQVCAAAHTPAKAAPLERAASPPSPWTWTGPTPGRPPLTGSAGFFVGYAGPRFAETLGALAAAARRAGARRLVKLVEAGADVALELLELCVLIGLGDRASQPTGRSVGQDRLASASCCWWCGARLSLQRAAGAGTTGPCGLGVWVGF